LKKYLATEGAEIILIVSATIASTAKASIDSLRAKGINVGLLRIRVFRPFPVKDVARVLLNKKKAIVIDRNISYGKSGIFFDEIKGAFYNIEGEKPKIFGYIAGLGGRDVTPEAISDMVNDAMRKDKPEKDIIWSGVKL
jgi:pyruvate/2-oxoacid:ferredoxin oxidoreductase alpha subunit